MKLRSSNNFYILTTPNKGKVIFVSAMQNQKLKPWSIAPQTQTLKKLSNDRLRLIANFAYNLNIHLHSIDRLLPGE